MKRWGKPEGASWTDLHLGAFTTELDGRLGELAALLLEGFALAGEEGSDFVRVVD